MDITLMQIQNGTFLELMFFKKEIINYLSDKKFSTKSITLVKTLKLIDREISRRKNGKICRQNECSFEVTSIRDKTNPSKDINSNIVPQFLNENDKAENTELLNYKRGLEKYISENPHIVSRVATYMSSKDDKTLTSTNSFEVYSRKEFDLSLKKSFDAEEDIEFSVVQDKFDHRVCLSNASSLLDTEREEDFSYKRFSNLSKVPAFFGKNCQVNSHKFEKNSFSYGTESTDESSNYNLTLAEEEGLFDKKSTFVGSLVDLHSLSERLDSKVDLFFG